MSNIRLFLFYLFSGLFILISLGLLSLTNQGVLTFHKPFVDQLTDSFLPNQGKVVFENVNLIPMDRERIVENQTVVVQDGIITQINDSESVTVLSDALRIDGKGKYLIPGLTDMHVHVKEDNELLLFAANGVTSIRNMWGGSGALRLMGFPDHLIWREQLENGDMFGPTLYTSGPILEGPPKTMPLMDVYDTPEAAAEAVSWQVAQGYDFIKVYDHLDLATYNEVIKTANELSVKVGGHVPKQVGLEQALASGQYSIEHLSGFIDSDTAEYLLPEEELVDSARLTKEAGTWICPTIAVYQMHVPDEELDLLEDRPEMAYISPSLKLTWKYFSRPGAMSGINFSGDYPARIQEMFISTTRILHENGVKFILGTDSDNPYLVPGFSLLDELDYLVEAGFTPFEALEAGTRNPAEAMGELDEFGTIEIGKRADLILLNANPLNEITNIRSRAGVMLRGQWFSESELQGFLQELIASYSPTFIDRIWPLGLIGASVGLFVRNLRKSIEGNKYGE